MNQSTSKTVNAANVCRRLAALLATLALLASMTLPVYAEALENAAVADDTQTTASEVVADDGAMSEDNTTPDTTGAGKTADDAADTTEDTTDSENSEQESDDKQTEQPEDAIDEDTDEAIDDLVDDSAQDASDAEEQPEDEAIESNSDIVLQDATAEEDFWIYFAPPLEWGTPETITLTAKKGGDGTGAKLQELTKVMTQAEFSTTDGRQVYGAKLHYSSGFDSAGKELAMSVLETLDCPYNGYASVKFSYGDKELTAISAWTARSDFNNKCFSDGNWIETSSLAPKHQRLAGKPMAFKNSSKVALANVTAHFYEKDTNGELIEIQPAVALDTVEPNSVVSFTIPVAVCSYVKFTATVDGKTKDISGLYNFYNETVTTEESKFNYSSDNRYCYIYSGTSKAQWGATTGRTLYFDATFSKLDPEKGYSIPKNGGSVYYYLTGTDKAALKGTMNAEGNDLYSVALPDGYDKVVFASYQYDPSDKDHQLAWCGDSTALCDIPNDQIAPCFYADTSDDYVYNTKLDNQRGGYWEEVGTLRDAEAGKSDGEVVDVESKTFTQDSGTKYISSTLYDYYTDWELNGKNRDKYSGDNGMSQRNWVTFRQFDQALSDYYSSYNKDGKTVQYPIYTGHFQPDFLGGNKFSEIANALNLYGWTNYNTFMAVNNSTTDIKGKYHLASDSDKDTNNYTYVLQGLVSNELNSNDEPTMQGTDLVEPHFNKAFLEGANTKNAVLGKVYENVDFPFTKAKVFFNTNTNQGDDFEYWHYDAGEKSLYLKQKEGTTDQYFLEAPANGKDDKSQNVDSSSNGLGAYGYFPFNATAKEKNANTYNYGFGTKLQFDFTLTDDGTVMNSNGQKVSIKFFFSGDDDVWVFIDGKLALDVGGAHGKCSGLLEFGKNCYTPYVSKAKDGVTKYGELTTPKTIQYLNNTVEFKYAGKETELSAGTHTLTFFYMERGMWESNMAVAFNFPDHNELQVEKKVELSAVNELFQSCFQNRELFTFNIKNLATHYDTKEAQGTGKIKTETVDLTKATPNPATTNMGDKNLFKLDTNPKPETNDTGQVLHWYAQYTDTNSQYRDKRYGILTLGDDDTINISQMKYLTFKVYVKAESGQSTPSISNMYLELRDAKDKKKGGVNGASLSGTTYGTVTMAENQWITIKLDLDKLKADNDFRGTVQSIYFGCNYPRNIYLKDFVFTSAMPDAGMVGFTTQQQDIPDYKSATSGNLENAYNARFTSTKANAGTQVVDKDGNFLLADGETVTFTDQFRRGSYISLNEVLNTDLFTTTWTLYENGQEVTKMEDGKTVENPGQTPNLVNQPSTGSNTGPNDGRTEVWTEANHNNGYTATGKAKPADANTIVFRSYSNPDSDSDAAFTKLKVRYVNTVKTGSLTIKKAAPEGEKLDGDYKFRITFSNVGGLSLETDPIPTEITIHGTDSKTIDGIPLGTRFRVEEIDEGGDHLQKIEFTGDNIPADAEISDGKQARGTVVTGDTSQVEVTFTNTTHELFDLDLTKQWKDADGNVVTADLPEQIYVQLQRKKETEPDTEWKAVKYPEDSTVDYVTITPDNGGWNYKFANLDRTDVGDTSENNRWTYRVVEGTLKKGASGKDVFELVEDGGTLLLKDNVYQVSGGTETAGENNNSTVTLTNTRQNPKFDLDVIKKSADEENVFLGGVEFTLDKLDESGNAITTDGYPKYGITNNNGELMLKGENGEATTTKAFENLDAGTYRLTETKTQAGYSLLSGPITIQFTQDGKCYLNGSKITVSTTEKETEFEKNTTDGSYTLTLTVLNRKVPELPHTGADAPSLWLLIGLPLAVAGLLVLVFRYNKKGGRTK